METLINFATTPFGMVTLAVTGVISLGFALVAPSLIMSSVVARGRMGYR